jgi:hypothetical protein
MSIRMVLLAVAMVAAAHAQSPQPARGRGVAGGGGMIGPAARPGARLVGAEVGMPGRVVKNAPFSADIVTESTQALADGNRIKQSSTVRFYRDSEGRTRREQSLRNLASNSKLPEVAFISDPVAGANYALDLDKRTVTKTGSGRGGFGRMAPAPGQTPGQADAPRAVAPGEPRPAMRGRGSENVRTESLGRQIVEGVQADGVRTTMTIPAGQIGNENAIQVVTETWYSPELQTYVLRKRSDPRSGDSTTRYTNISRTEPSRVLFEPPADFKTVEPRGFRKQ